MLENPSRGAELIHTDRHDEANGAACRTFKNTTGYTPLNQLLAEFNIT
jgi:hypothetical protein